MNADKPDSTATPVAVKETRHILGLSGGKDRAALAIYLKQQCRADRIEYFFCDTGRTASSQTTRTTARA